MKKYDSYKDSGVEWIGEIPSHWNAVKIKFVSSYNDEVVPENYDEKNEIEYVEISDVSFSEGIKNTTKYKFKDAPSRARRVTRKGDIIVSTVRTYLKAIAKIDRPKLIVSTGFIVIRPNIDPDFMAYAANTEPFIAEVVSQSVGVSYPAINSSQVVNIKIAVPPPIEQQAISSYLTTQIARVDSIIEARESKIKLLEELRTSVISKAVSKGIRKNADTKDSCIEWIGQIPKHWEVKKIKYIKSNFANAFVDGPFGSNLKSQHFVDDGDVYVIESGMITTGKFVFPKRFKTITAEHFETIKRSECKGHDIIIAKIGMNFGMAGELPYLDKPSVVSGNSLKISLNENEMLNQFFIYLLGIAKKNGGYIGVVQETAQPALSLSGLNNFGLPVPPLEEQKEILRYIESKTKRIDLNLNKAQSEIELLKEYRSSLITEVITGKRKVI